MKEFFGIKENHYVFEWGDVSALLTVLNVVFILMGYTWAPMLGLVNSILTLTLCIKSHAHLNMYVMQFALIQLNLYFLK